MTFHIARIAEIAEGIKAGNWLIKIQPDMINGYGYATPLFYPQLFLYIPALLYVIGFPLHTSYQIFIVFFLTVQRRKRRIKGDKYTGSNIS